MASLTFSLERAQPNPAIGPETHKRPEQETPLLPDGTSLALFIAAGLLLNLTPGPDMLYVIGNSLGKGRRAGVVSALGIGAGSIVHTAAAALGLSALMMSSAVAFDVVRLAGAAYLLYLGIRTLGTKAPTLQSGRAEQGDLAKVFRQGAITNILNPKVALFFLAFLPQFVDPARGSVVLQFILLGCLFNTSGTTVNTVVALAAGSAGEWIGKRSGLSAFRRWFTGSVFVALGARLALASR